MFTGDAMATTAKRKLTVAEYLAFERASETRHEFFRGEVFAMNGGAPEHSVIGLNIGGELRGRLKHRPCQIYNGDTRIRVDISGLYTYPDVSALCGKPKFDDERGDTLLNPSLLVEVLSPSTEAYDRGKKFEHYRRIPSLTEYLLVSQDQCLVERYSRMDDGDWRLTVFNRSEDVVVLESLDCELPLTEIYLKIEFPAQEPADSPVELDQQ